MRTTQEPFLAEPKTSSRWEKPMYMPPPGNVQHRKRVSLARRSTRTDLEPSVLWTWQSTVPRIIFGLGKTIVYGMKVWEEINERENQTGWLWGKRDNGHFYFFLFGRRGGEPRERYQNQTNHATSQNQRAFTFRSFYTDDELLSHAHGS
jgi:hypothetical protein